MTWRDFTDFFTKTIPSAGGAALGAVAGGINTALKPIFGSETGVMTPALNQFVKDSGIRGDASPWENIASFAEKGGRALGNFTEKGIGAVKSSPVGLIPGVSQTLGTVEEGIELTKKAGDVISAIRQ